MWSEILVGVVIVLGTVALTLTCYFGTRYIAGGEPEGHTKELASSVIFRLTALHGLILALVFAQEMIQYQQIKADNAIEANAVADVYFDADRYNTPLRANIQDPLYDYVRLVIGEEWQSLGDKATLSPKAWGEWDAAYNVILNLAPQTERQKLLRDHMLNRIHAMSETRVKREAHAAEGVNLLFWLAAMVGVVFIALAYYPYPPRLHNLILMSIFGAFTGIIVFFIYAFSNPFNEPGALHPTAFQQLLVELKEARSGD